MIKIDDCKYNKMVECPPKGRTCYKCGWNPDVAADRIHNIRLKIKQEEEANDDKC